MNHHDQDASFIAEALPVFISEAQEQLEALEHLAIGQFAFEGGAIGS